LTAIAPDSKTTAAAAKQKKKHASAANAVDAQVDDLQSLLAPSDLIDLPADTPVGIQTHWRHVVSIYSVVD
jgi:hypothetical protein